MKILIVGYGKMGKEIEKYARAHNIPIYGILDKNDPWPSTVDDDVVAIEFTEPSSAIQNIKKCITMRLPVVCGTTGWYDQLDEVKNFCLSHGGKVIYGSNFSPGVNALFLLTKYAANLFSSLPNYDVKIEETHHITKKDKPSGTAITLAKQILPFYDPLLQDWSLTPKDRHLWIEAFRKDQEIGMHKIIFKSPFDSMTIEHQAFSREGFAQGAFDAAKWILHHKGFFHFLDIFEDIYTKQ